MCPVCPPPWLLPCQKASEKQQSGPETLYLWVDKGAGGERDGERGLSAGTLERTQNCQGRDREASEGCQTYIKGSEQRLGGHSPFLPSRALWSLCTKVTCTGYSHSTHCARSTPCWSWGLLWGKPQWSSPLHQAGVLPDMSLSTCTLHR